ncbi:MAG: DNA integrity scanning protein DisA nucleotide-binding domain protein [Planctomycetaceae bacterium]
MTRQEITKDFHRLLLAAARLTQDVEAAALVVIAEQPLEFAKLRPADASFRVIVASDQKDVLEAAKREDVDVISIQHEPQTRQFQVSQVLLEAIADELLQTGDVAVVVYSAFEKDVCDTATVVHLAEQLSRLTSRDLQRLETKVPLETLRIVVDLACEIGREGREGKPVGTLFVVGNHRKVMELSTEQVHDPFRGYPRSERSIRNPRVRESIKELAQIDGAFVISSDGIAIAAGRHLRASADGLTLSKGLGSRHWAAAEISRAAGAIAIAVSESTGTVRVFQDGRIVLRIEPMRNAMKWHDVSSEAQVD